MAGIMDMSREEAAGRIREHMERHARKERNSPFITHALGMAIEALRGPWVKTSDRLPTEADVDELGRVLLMCVVDKWCNCVPVSTIDADDEWYWMPIPPMPEVEE